MGVRVVAGVCEGKVHAELGAFSDNVCFGEVDDGCSDVEAGVGLDAIEGGDKTDDDKNKATGKE